jgi:hypothetical protein
MAMIVTIAIVTAMAAELDASNATINNRRPRGDGRAQKAPRGRRSSSATSVDAT